MALFAPAVGAAQTPNPTETCRIGDKRIAELSGMAADDDHWYAVNDGGSRISVYVLTRDCRVDRVITNRTDPFDVEDMALAADGTIWLADTGDNGKSRATVALHKVTEDGRATLFRLSYPDGQHDAEALLLGRDGVPHLVTKSPFGPALVYRPAGPLTSPGPTPLVRVGEVRLSSTATPGGPTTVPSAINSVLVTGGAVSADGGVVALRTYTDAYLYPAPDGDVVAALARQPARVPLPNEPQGEAIAFEPDGTLLSASEGTGQLVRAVPDAVDLVGAPRDTEPARGSDAAPAERDAAADGNPAGPSGLPTLSGIGVAAVVVLGLLVYLGRRGRR